MRSELAPNFARLKRSISSLSFSTIRRDSSSSAWLRASMRLRASVSLGRAVVTP